MHLMFQGLEVSSTDGRVTVKWKIKEKTTKICFPILQSPGQPTAIHGEIEETQSTARENE